MYLLLLHAAPGRFSGSSQLTQRRVVHPRPPVASTTSNLITNNVLTGLASALDTLAAQAYGAGRLHQVGLYTQRVAAFMALCCVPLAAALWHAGAVLRYAVDDAEVVALVQLFLRINVVRLPAFVLFECGKRFFQAQGIFHAMTAILVFAAPFNAALMWFLVWNLNWGFVGAPVAVVVTENVATLLLWLYFLFVDGSQCWGGFTRAALRDWGECRSFLPLSPVESCGTDSILPRQDLRHGSVYLVWSCG